MTWWGWLLFGTVALWLAPASLWRPVALALLIQWAVAEALYQYGGDRLPLPVYIVGDCAVIAVVLLWRSHWSDWLVIAPYPAAWWLYVQAETREQWIWLYVIALGQFVVAGAWPQAQRIWGHVSHGRLRPIGETRGV